MNKVIATPEEAIADIQDGATIAIAGFSVNHGFATTLLVALRQNTTVVVELVKRRGRRLEIARDPVRLA